LKTFLKQAAWMLEEIGAFENCFGQWLENHWFKRIF